MKRQNLRKLVLLISLLLFPITIFYFSPAIPFEGGSQGIINGSLIVFAAMFIFSMFLGRIFCSWLCPGGGLQEAATIIQPKPPAQGWRNYIKYVIWVIWLGSVVVMFLNGNKNLTVDFFFATDHGISVARPMAYTVYYGIILLILVPALFLGKRSFCHYLCWMAPFMILGYKLGRRLHLPQLRVKARGETCISCKKCSKVCPMGLPVEEMATKNQDLTGECIQCGACLDICPKDVLKYTWKSH